MNMIIVRMIILILAAQAFGCSSKPAGNDPATVKVSEQRLSTYTPLRRLSYRNACGSNGPITLCVERITISENAALLEMRIHNSSERPYVLGNGSPPSLLLTNSGGSALKGQIEKLEQIPASAAKHLCCKLDGNITGKLKELNMEDIAATHHPQGKRYNKITVALGG